MFQDKPVDPSKPVIISSPGPTSISGKAISSRNAMKHGCCACDTLLLPTESAEDLKALEVIWLKAYNPITDAERHLVQELAHADWFLQRSTRAYADVEAGLYAATPNPVDWTEAQERKLGRFLRYKTAHTNNVIKCRKAVEDYRKARLSEKASEQKSALTQERLKTAQKKANPTVDWKQHLQNMRDQAISMGFTVPNPAAPTKL